MKLKVIELFAGVGGFRLGLEGWRGKSSSSNYKLSQNSNYEIIWSNQWEPSTKTQHANLVYSERWKTTPHNTQNIEDVIEFSPKEIPDHDLLVGGFPCQDYSVATTLKSSKGLIGKKGVLWWSIYSILKLKVNQPTKYLFLENVDRLLISPTKQRGRDFAVMLNCLDELGYAVEWRVINAADYGMPQRRRRVYIIAYHKTSALYAYISNLKKEDILCKEGIFASAFPVKEKKMELLSGSVEGDKETISKNFNRDKISGTFLNSGFMINGIFYTVKLTPKFEGSATMLGDIIVPIDLVNKSFYLEKDNKLKNTTIKPQVDGTNIIIDTEWAKWQYLKGSKNEVKTNKSEGYSYKYTEGGMKFPDPLDSPSRTIITGEGGSSPSRFKHVIEQEGKLRRLIPLELERLNMFPDNHTKLEGISDTKRAFFMGNALVVGVVEKIGSSLANKIKLLEKSVLQH